MAEELKKLKDLESAIREAAIVCLEDPLNRIELTPKDVFAYAHMTKPQRDAVVDVAVDNVVADNLKWKIQSAISTVCEKSLVPKQEDE